MIEQKTNYQKFLITATLACLIFYLPLILQNDYYRDDYFRIIDRYPGWTPFGRPFADIFAYFISADWQWLPDSSPFFLIISLCLVVFSTCYALKYREIPFNTLTAILLITFIFNPFFLSSLLYRFDCLIMSAGLACSLFGWAYFKTSKLRAVFFNFLAMGFYQSFINVFIILIIIETSYYIYKGDRLRTIFTFLFKGMIISFISMLLYYVIMKLFIIKDAETKATLIFFAKNNILSHYSIMLENVYSRYFGFLSTTGKFIYGLIFIIGLIEIQLRFYKDTHFSHALIRAALLSFGLILLLPLSLGMLYGIVGNERISPRMMAAAIFFSVALLFLLMRFLTRLQQTKAFDDIREVASTKLTWFCVSIALLYPLVFSYIINNAIRNQNIHDRYVVEQLANALENYPAEKSSYILGSFNTAPFVSDISEKMHLISHLLPRNADWTLWLRLKEYGFNNVIWAERHINVYKTVKYLCDENIQPEISRRFFKIYPLNNKLFIWLGKQPLCKSEYLSHL
ncbi:glucosyltransferase domain-containing protein [Bartonella tamiae]|uniref:Glycosyltransferase RgtA/B/C/D-like domain-containing protein n=1 Tax=Bartonella tamiae Th239 TaxID=1094558 RepID=J0QZM9_9HYPH|nr:glucosyltransferase domain-containing protein [Bartonella tamiae]EJF88704.1 hypothetical protein ME5_01255 [Bartonella tamiae Th239]EJF95046.1 hypothetical protein MEG_00627 [Bartonella tamiae Th307]